MSEHVQAIPRFIESREATVARRGARPTTREWLIHSTLFFLTFVTTTFAGLFLAAPADLPVSEPTLSGPFSYLLYPLESYLRLAFAILSYALSNPSVLIEGLTFAMVLLTILTAHEMGHYVACRRYGVEATLPFFIPAPPLFLAGTFGAFIKMKSPIPSRRALFDIGLAGPLAGFVVVLPVAVIGVLNLESATLPPGASVIIFSDPLLIRLIARLSGTDLSSSVTNPFYMAAWIGLLVTSLNLMPVGQLDGGHGTFAVFGPGLHRKLGRVAFVTIAVIAILGFVWYGSPSGFLYTVLLAVMLRVRHPAPDRMEPLGKGRIVAAIVTLLVFTLSFLPFPILIT
jgi:membrane-associated protease RseP (regulator of RpoE activity)